MNSLPRALRLALAAALCALALAPAVHADSRYLEPQTTAPVDPVRFVQGRDGAIWSFDGDAVRHTDAGGRTTTLQRRSPLLDTIGYGDGIATADGGLIAYAADCELLRITGDLRATWSQPENLYPCKGVDANAQGISWTGGTRPGDGDNFVQRAPDGTDRLRMRIGGEGVLIPLEELISFKALADNGLLVLSRIKATQRVVLARYRGAVREWQWQGEPGTVQAFALTADGGVLGVGVVGGELWATRLDAQGALQHSRRSATSDGAVLALEANGAVFYTVTGDAADATRPRTLQRIAADGTLAWQQPLCTGASGAAAAPADIAVGSNGSVANLCATAAQDRLLRRSIAGAVDADVALPFDRALQLRSDAAGTLLVLGREQAQAPYRTRLVAIDSANQIRDTALRDLSDVQPLTLAAGQIDSDGASYLVTQEAAGGGRYGVSKIGADGTRAWRRDIPGFDLRSAQLQVNHGRACIAAVTGSSPQPESPEKQIAFCLDAQDGKPFGTQEETLPGSDTRLQIRPLATGQTLLLRLAATGYTIVRQDAGGAVLTTSGTGRVTRAGSDAQGRVMLAIGERVVRHAADGSTAYTVSQSPLLNYASEFALAADGSVYVVGQERGQDLGRRSLWALAPDGTTRWLVPLQMREATSQILVGADAVYVMQFARADQPVVNRVSRIDRADGRERWWHDGSPASAQPGRMALSADGSRLLLAYTLGNRVYFGRLDAATRRVEHERQVACGDGCAGPLDLEADAGGSARIILATAGRASAQTAAVLTLDHAVADTPRIRVGQPGVAGLWHAPYTNGQGLAIDWLPASNTLFAAWFTHDPTPRWFTLQVNGVSPDATELELPILMTGDGNFDAGPPVAPDARAAGKATLRFSDCSNASLRYELFDPTGTGLGHTRSGTITLSRVTPATQPCVLADGSNQPGAGAQPPANGFDARLSGAWYDPGTLGQGLQLNIQPGGVFFAPWFTFDPAGAANSARRQHWFTLQGDLSQARDGRVEAQLIQTIGGVFDQLPTYNINPVGSATLQILACDRARLDYRFTDPLIAGLFTGLGGSLELTRMGGCMP